MLYVKIISDFPVSRHNKIGFIKELRSVSGMGLSEAKAIADIIESCQSGIAFTAEDMDRESCAKKLWSYLEDKLGKNAMYRMGYEVFNSKVTLVAVGEEEKKKNTTLKQDIEACIVRAVKEENWKVARALLDMHGEIHFLNW